MQDKKDKVFTMRCSDEEQKFLTTALKWFRAQTMLLEIGSIKQIPPIFTTNQQTISASGIVSGGTVELPQFVEDVLNGGTYPNPEDCTQEERAVLYNPMFQEHYKRYMSTKPEQRSMIRIIINEFVEHNFPMLMAKKDTK